MEQNSDKTNNIQEKINSILKKNKIKILIFISILIILIFSSFLFNENKKKNNVLISEKYFKATIFLLED
jgi:flagellar biosynthesis/type III secretory pathway M-ring protein FliF/YscJ